LPLRRKARGLNHGRLCTAVHKCVRRQRPQFGRFGRCQPLDYARSGIQITRYGATPGDRLGDRGCRPGGYCACAPLSFLRRVTGLLAWGTRQVLPGTGEFSAFRCSSSSRTQAGEFPRRLGMRPCGLVGTVRRLGGLLSPARETAMTAPLITDVVPRGQPGTAGARIRKGEHYPIREGQDRPRLLRCP
jgi:hypothetical protein